MTNVTNIQESYKDVIAALRQERDELRVRIHLANMEIHDEWEQIERKWEHLQSKGHDLSEATGKSAHEIGEAFSILGGELKEAYRRLKRAL